MKNKIIVIVSAGMGKRMKSIGPKANIFLSDGETVLERQIRFFRSRYPEYKIVVVVGFMKDKIKYGKYKDVTFVENEDFENTNSARSILCALESCSCDEAIICCGDLVFNENMIKNIDEFYSCLVMDTNAQYRSLEVGCMIEDSVVINFDYGIYPKWSQIAFLQKREIELFKYVARKPKTHKWFIFEVINESIKIGAVYGTHFHKDAHMVEIDCPQDIKRARIFAQLTGEQK